MIPYRADLWNDYLKILLNPPISNHNNVSSSKTPKTHASYLVLMMIGSLILKIDPSPYVREFNQLLDTEDLDALKKDLENLSIFYKKGLETLIVVFLTKGVTKNQILLEKWHNERFRDRKIVTKETIVQRRRILKQTVSNYHEFLVFHQFEGSFRSNESIIRIIYKHMNGKKFSPNGYVGSEGRIPILEEHLNETRYNLDSLYDRYLRNRAHFELVFQNRRKNVERKTRNRKVLCRGTIRLGSNDLFDFSSIDENNRSTVTIWIQDHSCNQLSCIICFGWLWVPIFYCVVTFFTILYDMCGRFINSFRII